MAQISLTVVRADTGAAFDVDLPDDVAVSELLAELVKEMGLPMLGPDHSVIAYELSNKRTGDWVRDGTLSAKGVKIGDVMLLTSTFVAGWEVFVAEVGYALLGALGVLSIQATVAVARRLLGLKSRAERADALRAEAELRAIRAEETARLAELQAAHLGGIRVTTTTGAASEPRLDFGAAPSKRVQARPIDR